jgi:acetate kinase
MDMLGDKNAKIITCLLGNGSSITATMNGKAIDTSMGFTPNDGVPMGTRCGPIDPTVVTYIQKAKGLTAEEADKLINSKSGLLGVSGISSDCRDIRTAAKEGNSRAKLALNLLKHNIKKVIGSYIAEMNGVDAIVFTAGIGENDKELRAEVLTNMEFLGIEFDKELNEKGEVDITGKNSKVKVFVIPTNEEYMIALDTMNLAK